MSDSEKQTKPKRATKKDLKIDTKVEKQDIKPEKPEKVPKQKATKSDEQASDNEEILDYNTIKCLRKAKRIVLDFQDHVIQMIEDPELYQKVVEFCQSVLVK